MDIGEMEVAPEAPGSSAVGAEGAEGGDRLDLVEKLYAAGAEGRVDQAERLLEGLGVSLPCERPVRVVDRLSGEELEVRCKSRRHRECVSCSALYGGDAARILRSGALDVDPSSVVVMLTLTAPSFGKVHRVVKGASPRLSETGQRSWNKRAARSRCRCGEVHQPEDPLVGVALDDDLYGYAQQAAWNSAASRLWNRTATRIARELGLDHRLQYAGVAELQARGAVHFHLICRIPAGTPLGLAYDKLGRLRARVLEKAVGASSTVVDGLEHRWGDQIVAEVLAMPGAESGRLVRRTTGYLRKSLAYSVKDLSAGPEDGGGSPSRRRHLGRCHAAARLVDCPACDGRRGGCGSPRHRVFGYGGHPLRRSRDWCALTFRVLREQRVAYWRTDDDPADADVQRDWMFVGIGFDGTAATVRRGLAAQVPP